MPTLNSHCKSQRVRAAILIGLALMSLVAALTNATWRGQAAIHKRQTLTFEDRVAAQRAIEEVYWRHRIWPKDNPRPKPPLDEVMPDSAVRAKVEDYLRMSRALEVYWQRPITGDQLQAEMERMARQTKKPGVLLQGGVTAAALGRSIGSITGAAIQAGMDNQFIRSCWFYLEYKKPDGSLNLCLLETDKRSSAQVIEKAKAVFGARVTITSFDEKPKEIKKKQLKGVESKYSLEGDRENRPAPEIKPDKALVVSVCPPMTARYAGHGDQVKLHANDQVVAVH